MIDEILPAGTAAVVALGDNLLGEALLPEEERALGHVAAGRRREFILGRTCARRALGELGVAPTPILRGPQRQPLWPDGFVGSITHCAGYCAAAVAPQTRLAAIGIDAEVHNHLPAGVLDLVAVEDEREWLGVLGRAGVCWDRVLFSAKESVYKAWFVLTGTWLGFRDCCINVDAARGTFRTRLMVDGPVLGGCPIHGFEGRYLARGGYVVTLVAVPAVED